MVSENGEIIPISIISIIIGKSMIYHHREKHDLPADKSSERFGKIKKPRVWTTNFSRLNKNFSGACASRKPPSVLVVFWWIWHQSFLELNILWAKICLLTRKKMCLVFRWSAGPTQINPMKQRQLQRPKHMAFVPHALILLGECWECWHLWMNR